MMEVWISTDVTAEPVSSAEAKLFAKIPSTADDTVVTYLISSAREKMEKFTGCSLAPKTLIAEWDRLPSSGMLELPYGPIASVTSVIVVDQDGVEDTLVLNSDYWLSGKIWIKIKVGAIFPSKVTRLKVTYTAGYGSTGVPALPAALKESILKRIVTQYDFRENIAIGAIAQEMKNKSEELAAPYRRGVWFGGDL